jgi:hypothetical protein
MQIESYFNLLQDYFYDEDYDKFKSIFDAIQFKLNRNDYHLNNIKRIVLEAKNINQDFYYEEIVLPIYYEMEGFLVSLRSSVDISLHLVNFAFKFGLESNDVNLFTIYRHASLPKSIKNVLERYTRPYDNKTWNFIYTFRNEIVHEKSIDQVLPLNIDFFSKAETINVYFDLHGENKEMIIFFQNCIRFLDTFSGDVFHGVKVGLQSNHRIK